MDTIGINLNITVWDEHIPEIEQYIWTIKERIRAMTNMLPFDQLPHQLIVEIAFNEVFWINCFPHKDGIHNTFSPLTVVTGSKIDFNKHCRLQLGAYVQIHEQHNNSLFSRTAGAIALFTSGNEQARYYYLSLHRQKSGKKYVDSISHSC